MQIHEGNANLTPVEQRLFGTEASVPVGALACGQMIDFETQEVARWRRMVPDMYTGPAICAGLQSAMEDLETVTAIGCGVLVYEIEEQFGVPHNLGSS